ncbi:MAG TPA: heme-copper oxidase subunit III, partial [Pyrinomonadaceae bacterium]|nr:heme-copper oxidase subunit III [Pyrinomonadaceae bacterium]
NDGGGNGGDNNPKKQDFENEYIEEYVPNKPRILMWFLLMAVLMTFGGLIEAYLVIASNNVLEWKPFNLPVAVWISTALILASSFTYLVSKKALQKENQEKAKNWLLATTVLGAAFISSQILAWLTLVQRGLYVQSNPYAGFFYILTAVHAVHVIGGICALGYIVLRTWHKTFSDEELEYRKNISSVIGWYWHTMDGLWLVLFFLLGFWK